MGNGRKNSNDSEIQKVTYNVFRCFRTSERAAEFSMVNSVFDTGRKQGLSPKDIVFRVFNENYLGIFNDECREILMAHGAPPTLT